MDFRQEFFSWISAFTSSRRLFAFSHRAVRLSCSPLVLRHMGVMVNAVLYQPCDDVQLIGQFRFFLFESGGVKDSVLDKAEGLNNLTPTTVKKFLTFFYSVL